MMHCGPLMVNDDKMSKSLGNFSTIRDTIAIPDTLSNENPDYEFNVREAEMLRFFIVRNHYRSPQNYALSNLYDAQNALDRLYQTLLNVPPAEITDIDWSHPHAQAFQTAMNDDFNTAGAVAALFDLSATANRNQDSQASGLMLALGQLLGLLTVSPDTYLQSPTRYHPQGHAVTALSPEQIEAYIEQRQQAKLDRDFATADEIRERLAAHGVELEDKPGGLTHWRYR